MFLRSRRIRPLSTAQKSGSLVWSPRKPKKSNQTRLKALSTRSSKPIHSWGLNLPLRNHTLDTKPETTKTNQKVEVTHLRQASERFRMMELTNAKKWCLTWPSRIRNDLICRTQTSPTGQSSPRVKWCKLRGSLASKFFYTPKIQSPKLSKRVLTLQKTLPLKMKFR